MDELEIKKDFTDIYTQESPYKYLSQMRKLWYRIPDVTKPLYESLQNSYMPSTKKIIITNIEK